MVKNIKMTEKKNCIIHTPFIDFFPLMIIILNLFIYSKEIAFLIF